MDTRKIPVFCYWDGCIKDGPDGPFYEGSSPRVIRVESKTKLPKLLDNLHRVTGFEKGKFQIGLIGRYPSIVQQSMVKYVCLPIVDDCSLETMLEVPSYHPSLNNVEFYLEFRPVSSPVSHHSPLANTVSFSANQTTRKRSRTVGASVDADVNASVKDDTLRTPQEDNNNGWLEEEQSTDAGNCGNCVGNNEAVQKKSNLEKSGPTNVPNGRVPKQMIFSPWVDERELQVGMLFRDKDELDRAVKLYSNRRQRRIDRGHNFFSDEYSRTCGYRSIWSSCKWSLRASKTKENGYVITEYTGPHTCEPESLDSDFLAGEIESLIRAQPSISVAELSKWVKEEFGYTDTYPSMFDVRNQVIIAILGESDQSLNVLPKFMAALCSSNKMLVEWQYDPFPDPKDASFRSVFWSFKQSIEGFPHCRPLIMVDTVDLSGKYPGKLLVAAGLDAKNRLFPLAFAITTKESLSADTWRWFFACIRKKVTQREDICLITSLNPDIVAVVKEPECQWAHLRYCLTHLCLKFYDAFSNNLMTEFVYKAGSTNYKSSFDYYLKKLEEMNPEARKWLDQIPLRQWALSHDDGGLRFGIIDTSLIFAAYGFLNKSSDLPITSCVLLIFEHLVDLFKTRHGHYGESVTREIYANHVMTKLEEYKVASNTLDVLPLDETGERFQVTEVMQVIKKKFMVHRSDLTCTCGIWQLYKYPCSHVIAVCRKLNIDHLQYVNDYYKTERFLGVYASEFSPLPGVSEWPEASEVPRLLLSEIRPPQVTTEPTTTTSKFR